MEAPQYQALDALDPLDVMMEDRDILGLIDPEETAEMLQSLQYVLEKDIDMVTDSDDVNNNTIVQAPTPSNNSPVPMSASAEPDQAKEQSSSETGPETVSDSAAEDALADQGDGIGLAEDSGRGRSLRRSARQVEYNLRTSSILNRIETEQRRKMPKTPKPKNKPPPLSKYRRKTANSRERQRMQEINDAFVELQNAIPNLPANNAKLTKITTLRLALNYIASLREMLGYDDPLGLEWSPAGPSNQCTSPVSSSSSPGSVVHSPRASTDSDGMSVSTCSPGQRSGLDSEGESSYSS